MAEPTTLEGWRDAQLQASNVSPEAGALGKILRLVIARLDAIEARLDKLEEF